MALSFSLVLTGGLLYQLIAAQFQLFPNGTPSHSTANLSHGCITALNAVINCDPYIQYLVSNDYYGSLGNATLQNSVRAAGCGASLALYHTNVALAFTSDP